MPFPHNSVTSSDDDPSFTADALELYFNSFRNGPSEIFVSVRGSRSEAWGAPSLVPELSAGPSASNPVISPDGLTMWLSGRFDAQTTDDRDIYVSTRPDRQSTWSAPVLVTELNGLSVNDFPGSASVDGLTLITERGNDLFVATRSSPADAWSTPAPIAELNSNVQDRQAWLAHDGLSLYFDVGSNNDTANLVLSLRPSTMATWSPPTVITELSTRDGESDAWLTPDERYIMFTRSAVGEPSNIYEATR